MADTSLNQNVEQTRLILGIGECIVAWSNLEHKLADLFSFLVESEGPPLDYIWYSIISFEARMKCLNAACKKGIRDEDLIYLWSKLATKITRNVRKRNQLAHSTLVGDDKRPGKSFLAPYYTGDQFNDKQTMLTVEAVLEIRDSFLELDRAIGWFTYQRYPHKYTPEEIPQAPDLINHLQKKGGLIPEGK